MKIWFLLKYLFNIYLKPFLFNLVKGFFFSSLVIVSPFHWWVQHLWIQLNVGAGPASEGYQGPPIHERPSSPLESLLDTCERYAQFLKNYQREMPLNCFRKGTHTFLSTYVSVAEEFLTCECSVIVKFACGSQEAFWSCCPASQFWPLGGLHSSDTLGFASKARKKLKWLERNLTGFSHGVFYCLC